jgi:hypothetical protein
MTTEHSSVSASAAFSASSHTLPFFVVTWISPEESRMIVKTILPLDRDFTTQPPSCTSLLSGNFPASTSLIFVNMISTARMCRRRRSIKSFQGDTGRPGGPEAERPGAGRARAGRLPGQITNIRPGRRCMCPGSACRVRRTGASPRSALPAPRRSSARRLLNNFRADCAGGCS